jgi:hypothetical protein
LEYINLVYNNDHFEDIKLISNHWLNSKEPLVPKNLSIWTFVPHSLCLKEKPLFTSKGDTIISEARNCL